MSYWDQFQPAGGFNTTSAGGVMSPQQQQAYQQPTAIQQPAEPVRAALPSQPPQDTGGSDYEATFRSLFPGESLSPETLAANESKLPPGWRLLGPNAAGQRSKIELPNGEVIDVIQGAGSGQNKLQWQPTGGGGGGGGGLAGSLGNFQTGSFTGGGQYPLASVMGTGLAAPWTTPFVAPTGATEQNDPGYQFRLNEGIKAGEHNAAAKGTLLTGGFQKALGRYAQDYASGEYGNVYGRALGEYQMANQIFNQNQGNLYNRLFGVAGMGQDAAANIGTATGTYGTNAGNALTGIGSANAAGSVTQGAIGANLAQQLGNIAGSGYLQTHQPQYPGYPNTPPYVPGTPVYGQNGQVPGWTA